MDARAHRGSRLRTTAPCRQALVRLIKMVPMEPGWVDAATFKVDARLNLRLFLIPQSQHPLC